MTHLFILYQTLADLPKSKSYSVPPPWWSREIGFWLGWILVICVGYLAYKQYKKKAKK